MTEQRERMEKALHGCAESGIPDTVDLWPGIREHVGGAGTESGRSRRRWPLPRTRVGWVLVAVLVLLFSTGAYAARDALYETFRDELPGARGPVYGEKLDITRTRGGARVTVGWAYADERFVVVGFNVEDLKGGRRVAGQPADLLPVQISDPGHEGRIEKQFPDHVDLTDERGAEFWSVGGQQLASEGPDSMLEGPNSISAVFEAEERIEPGGKHRFRLEVPLQEEVVAALPPGEERWPDPESVGEPFVFEFEVPVRPTPVAEVGQEDTAGGLTLTLQRVSNSPARPQAVFCFPPPDDEHDWFPTGGDLEFGGGPVAGKGHCLEMLLNKPLEGRSTVTVTEIEGIPHCPSGNDRVCQKKERTIRGPWRFTFEAPGS